MQTMLKWMTSATMVAWTNIATAQAPEPMQPQPEPPPVVAVSTLDYTFITPDTLPAGWVTLRMKNEGQQEHFMSLYRLPPGMDLTVFAEQLLTPFAALWEAYAAGDADRDATWAGLLSDFPPWWYDDQQTVHVGGPALTEPGETATVTIHLEPGTYLMECYVKTPEGKWHTELGMMKQVSVTGPVSNAGPPTPDVTMTLRNDRVDVDGEFVAGPQVVAVTAADTPDGFARHDINLFRIDSDDDIAEIVQWMDWMDFEGFRAPAPGHSLGGMDAQVAGRTGYVHLDLAPGRYAWISEEYGGRGVMHAFTVE